LPKIIEKLDDRSTSTARSLQQLTMTSANNLALMLDEALKSMQQESNSSGSCSKPGGKKKGKKSSPSMSDLRAQQESMKKQLQDMIQKMKDGQGKPGKDGKSGMSKEMAQMLAQQEIFDQMMQQMQTGQQIGSESQKKLNEVKQLMEENKNDLINKNITPATLNRQNQIVTRLLEAENAERKREIDNKRESNEAKNPKLSNPETVFQYKKQNARFNENLKQSNLNLYNFYKNKYKDYLIKLTEEQ